MNWPFVLRNLKEEEETFSLQVGKGGLSVNMVTETGVFKDETGFMLIDENFQAVKTWRGNIVERRLYWDHYNMPKPEPFKPYPTPVLICHQAR